MRVLYYFPEYDTPMFQWQRVHIIDELSRHGVEFETFNPLIYTSPDEANDVFVRLMTEGGFDLLMSSVCYEGIFYPEMFRVAKKHGIPSLLIRWDNLTVPIYDKRQAKLFDLVWLTCRDTTHLYDKWGAKYIVQPYAANPFLFSYNYNQISRSVCFLGTPYGSRSLMINALTQAGVNVDLYYGGKKEGKEQRFVVKYDIPHPSYERILFHRLTYAEGRKVIIGAIKNKLFGSQTISDNACLHRFPSVPVSEISNVYSSHCICLASTSTNHTDSLKAPLKIVNLRSFEIPMSGGLALCRFNPELAEYFEDGKEVLFYNTNAELIEKARYYSEKATETELHVMKEAARKRAEREHTWWNRFTRVFNELGIRYE